MGESYPNKKKKTVRKGEIARYEQFLLFPQCFQKACFPGASKGVIVWEWVKHIYFTLIEKQVLTTYTIFLSILLPGNYTSTRAECVGQ